MKACTMRYVSAVLLGALASAPALADGRVRFGFYFGGPWYPAPYYYYPPAYYPPPVYAAPASPPVYVERTNPQTTAPQADNSWYYCPESKTYYPYVKECPGPWQRVTPQPPGS